MFTLKCPSCAQVHRVSEDVLGAKIVCPHCGRGFRVAGSKPRTSSDSLAPVARSQRPVDLADTYELEDVPQPPIRSVIPAKSSPPAEPRVSGSDRSSLPSWVYAGIGAAAVLVVGLTVVLVRMFNSGSTPPESPEFASQPTARAILEVAAADGASAAFSTAVVDNASPPPVQSAPSAASVPDASPPLAGDAPAAATAALSNDLRSTPRPDRDTQRRAAAPEGDGSRLTTAQIVERWEPSVALIKGRTSSGTGFLAKHGVVATNAHVVEGEFLSNLEVRFPSAPPGKQGPLPAQLLYEDPKRDLAFLAVSSDLPAVEIATAYRFLKGDDVTVIGNPGLGDEIVLENAISRGVLSSKTVIDGQNFIQLSASVNPGNSGGPVFDSAGRVIGVVTLKSMKAEALTFCIPLEDLQAAMAKVGPARPELVSHHRAELAFKILTTAGALYAIGLDVRSAVLRTAAPGSAPVNLVPNEDVQKFDEMLTTLDQKLFSLVDGEMPKLRTDQALSKGAQSQYQELSANYKSMKNLYAHVVGPADQYAMQAQNLRAKHLQLVQSLKNDLKFDVPAKLMTVLQQRTTVSQPPTLVMEIVPSHVQSRLFRGRIVQRGPIGPRLPGAMNPAQAARERMQQNLRDRARGFRPRINP
jgi:S1-C subfamily serine protease